MTGAPMQETGEPLDFAIAGNGFFAVQTTQGVRYTRDGQFTESAQGVLTDSSGNPVLDQGGAQIRVAANGTVPASSIGVFEVPSAVKQGENLFAGTSTGKGAGERPLRRARSIRCGRREDHGRNDQLPARLPVGPAGDPGDRADAAVGLDAGRLDQPDGVGARMHADRAQRSSPSGAGR